MNRLQHRSGGVTKIVLEKCNPGLDWCRERGLFYEHTLGVEPVCPSAGPLRCERFCRDLNRYLVENVLKMTLLKQTSTVLDDSHHPDKVGVSVVAIIAESHVSTHMRDVGLHTWSEFGFSKVEKDRLPAVRVVVDSCKKYDPERVVDFLVYVMKPRYVTVWVEYGNLNPVTVVDNEHCSKLKALAGRIMFWKTFVKKGRKDNA